MESLLDLHREGQQYPIQRLNFAMNASNDLGDVFISSCGERSQVEAEASFIRHKKGLSLGPLDGVPIAWKDNINFKGMSTTGGTKLLRDVESDDAALVKKMTQLGVVNIGKTNLSELAFSGLGLNPHYGTPAAEAPGHKAPGGSSSGSAIAVARGLVPIAMGTDTAGSLRVPAAFNGICAFRPSVGRHSLDGVLPLSPTMDTVGFLAGTPEDIITIERTLIPDSVSRSRELSEITLVYDPHWLDSEDISESVMLSFENHLQFLRESGVSVVQKAIPALKDFFKLLDQFGWLGGYEAAWQWGPFMRANKKSDFDERVWNRIQSVSSHSFSTVIHLMENRRVLMQSISRELGNSVLLMPTVTHTAPNLDSLESDPELFAQVNLATLRLTMFASFLDMPSFVQPSGVSPEGQFCSVQWSVIRGNDDLLLGDIELLGSVKGFHRQTYEGR